MIALLFALQDWVDVECERLRREKPEIAAKVDRPPGLDAANYRQFRNPVPQCLRDLVKIGKDAVPLLLQRWGRMDELTLSDAERDALLEAIVRVPGLVGDVRAESFLTGVLNSDAAESLRGHAAVSLGMIGAKDPLLPVLDDRKQPKAVRQACARAVGRLTDSLELIRARLDDDAIWRDLIAALGLLGSSWAWEARGGGDEVRKGCHDLLLEQRRRRPEESALVDQSLKMVDWK